MTDERGLVASPALPAAARSSDAEVLVLGRPLPRASATERLAWCALLVAVLSVLGLAVSVEPDPRGIGTHERLSLFGAKLQPCGFQVALGVPCPSCGYTTTFALAVRGRLVAAFLNQPFGFLVFLAAVGSVPVSLAAAVRGASPSAVAETWPWMRIFLVLTALWALAWAWKALGIAA